MHKDEPLDRLLTRASRARADARLPKACPDAETLAALADGSLTARECAAAETHAAECDRCLAVLAAIAKTTPPPSPSQRPSWLSVRWLVPLTTAAVAITAWVVLQDPQLQRPAVPPTIPAAGTMKPAEPAAQTERDAHGDPAFRPGAPSPQTRADALEKKAEAPARSRSKEATRNSRPADSRARDSAAAAPPPIQERAKARDETLLRQSFSAAQPATTIMSPDPSIRWRITGRSVERSKDGGLTWQPQPTDAGVDLLAGSSPAPTVCWIVGRGGVVLLSTDGETWRRLQFPGATIDLVAVTAVDETTATVTTSDGRTYRTTDAGRTWTLQGNPAAPF